MKNPPSMSVSWKLYSKHQRSCNLWFSNLQEMFLPNSFRTKALRQGLHHLIRSSRVTRIFGELLSRSSSLSIYSKNQSFSYSSSSSSPMYRLMRGSGSSVLSPNNWAISTLPLVVARQYTLLLLWKHPTILGTWGALVLDFLILRPRTSASSGIWERQLRSPWERPLLIPRWGKACEEKSQERS